MKVIVATEFLHEKDWITTHLEEILALYSEAMVVSLTFQPRSLGSIIESRTIVSANAKPDTLNKHSWMIPPLVQNMHIPNDTELVISLSRGYIHNIKIPRNCKHLSYFVDAPILKKCGFKNFLSRLLARSKKPLIDKKVYLSSHIAKLYGEEKPSLLNPFFKQGGQEFDRPEEKKREIDCIFQLSQKSKIDLSTFSEKLKGVKYLFFAPDHILDELITDSYIRSEHCYEKGCHGTQQKLFENVGLYVDLSNEVFNPLCFQALSAGSAVYVPQDCYQGLLTDEFSNFYETEVDLDLIATGKQVDGFDKARARRHALQFNGRIFKRNLSKFIEEALGH